MALFTYFKYKNDVNDKDRGKDFLARSRKPKAVANGPVGQVLAGPLFLR